MTNRLNFPATASAASLRLGFVVGAAHLIGKDSVIAMLEPLGYRAERIQ